MDPDTMENLRRLNEVTRRQMQALAEQQDALASTPLDILTSWPLLVLYASLAVVCVCGGAWVAAQRGRSKIEGALLGFFFGALGVLIEALLPLGKPTSEQHTEPPLTPIDDDLVPPAESLHYAGLLRVDAAEAKCEDQDVAKWLH